jgi:hypothetical protein
MLEMGRRRTYGMDGGIGRNQIERIRWWRIEKGSGNGIHIFGVIGDW